MEEFIQSIRNNPGTALLFSMLCLLVVVALVALVRGKGPR